MENVHSSHGIWTEYWVEKDLWKTIFATLTIVGICAGSETLKGVESTYEWKIFSIG